MSVAHGLSTMETNDGCDSDNSLTWEDFFGSSTSTDLVPTLLGMYDTLIGRSSQAAAAELNAASKRHSIVHHRSMAPREGDRDPTTVPRPLSITSIASSSSTSSSGTSSCSGRRLGAAPKSSAYLASIESLEDDSDEDSAAQQRQKPGGRAERLKCGTASQGSADSGVSSPCSYISSPCPPQYRPRYCDPHLSYMDRVVMEIIETEEVYVRDLKSVIEGYLERWKYSSDCPLSERQLHDLFNNIEDIYKFNSGFLQELEQCGLDPVQVACTFVKHSRGFAVYTQYCTNYPKTVSVLTELMRQEGVVRLFRERQSALQHTLPLGSYLLKPVQRILKYHLLLQNIVKHYVYEDSGYSDIVEALSVMTGIAHHINDMKRRHEHAVRVQEIQSLLYGWEGEDLTTFGELCAEGTFRMAGAKALRHVFLFDKMLLITKKKEESILGYKTHIMCSNLMLIESVPGEPFSFHVIPFDNPRLQHTLQARNLEQKREWTLQLKRVILENYNAVIPSHARQLVMELGQNRTDDEIAAEKTTPKKQHSAPEYLEKRKQERERRKSETSLRSRLRRSRKLDVGGNTGESSISQRRGRRASSSSRDRSESHDESHVPSPAKMKDRFSSWRRKSEPGCYSTVKSGSNESGSKLTVVCNSSSENVDTETFKDKCSEIKTSNMSAETVKEMENKCNDEISQDNRSNSVAERTKTLEEIVGHLLMQNREFQKILKKQQHCISQHDSCENFHDTISTKDETTDDDEKIYETLISSNTVHNHDGHRLPHVKELHNEQNSNTPKNMFSCRSSLCKNMDTEYDEDYVTLVYKKGASNECIPQFKQQNNKLKTKICANPRGIVKSCSDSINEIRKNNESIKDKMENECRTFGNYDNLERIWESVKRQQEEIQHLADGMEHHLRKTISLSVSDVNTVPSLSNSTLLVPTLPSVWLKQQGDHLATPSHKSGSLPRSFQVGNESDRSVFKPRLLTRDGRSCSDRPFTIASDKHPEINFEDIERYIEQSGDNHSRHRFPTHNDPEDSFTDYTATPDQSLSELNVHPEYKIYRPSMSKASLKHVISSVSSKLAGLRASSETLDADTDHEKTVRHQHRTNKIMHILARQYSKVMKHRTRTVSGDDSEEYYDCASSVLTCGTVPALPMYKLGSSGLGARIAHCSEYANPRILYPNIQPKDTRPDSVLSVSSNFTSSSEGDRTSGLGGSVDRRLSFSSITTTTTTKITDETILTDNNTSLQSEDLNLSDGSGDSFYERSFEAIERLMEDEIFRDSAVYSDQDDDIQRSFSNYELHRKESLSVPNIPTQELPKTTKTYKVPPPIPAKPENLKLKTANKAISSDDTENSDNLKDLHKEEEQLIRGLEGISKSIWERRKELELWKASREDDAVSQHSSASTVIEVCVVKDIEETEGGGTKGWVKHVIGKLQGDTSDTGIKTNKCQ